MARMLPITFFKKIFGKKLYPLPIRILYSSKVIRHTYNAMDPQYTIVVLFRGVRRRGGQPQYFQYTYFGRGETGKSKNKYLRWAKIGEQPFVTF